jgi:EAL domain-containing protein (putative c-di-GMP-specific phosphodiesterase class I)
MPSDCPLAGNLSPSAALEPAIQDVRTSQDRPLIVEITEQEPFPDDLGAGLSHLRDRGICVAVDDAGAGYASFTQLLLRLRPDIIKIDGELIAGIDDDPVKRALATALNSLASELHAKLVAEGVETPGQLQTLIRLGIEYGQGILAGPQELVHFFVRVDFICALQWHPTQLVAGRRVQCPASNSMGRVVGPLSAVSGFHGAGPVRRALGMRRVITARASANSRRARWAPRQ